ncbi:MAG: hypothetical protein ABEJ68_02720 [Halobacteriaceae archaeon]
MDERTQIGAQRQRVPVAVASGVGVVVVRVGGDRVGEFTLDHRCEARDVAVADGRLAVATPEDVLLGGDATPSDFGPAAVVGADGATVVAVDPDGRVARHDGAWETCVRVSSAVHAADGGWLATADGVRRIEDGADLGLGAVQDVAAPGWAATDDGLYRRTESGWERERRGAFVAVTVADGDVFAATTDAVVTRIDGAWAERESPVGEPVVDVCAGEGVYAVTERGTFLVDAGDGWRSRALGVPDVARMAPLGP